MTSGFGDDFYLVLADNRNGTPASSNTDVFFFRSTNGGSSWVGPTRVNDDRSVAAPNRNLPTMGNYGNDQWFPWIDVNADGTLALAFYDRRLDEDSQAHAWPTSRQRPGNYLTWRWGAGCDIDRTPSRECLAPGAEVIPQPTEPIDLGPGSARAARPGAALSRAVREPGSSRTFRPTWTTRSGPACSWATTTRSATRTSRSSRIDHDDDAVAIWTDARNGRGSGAPTSFQAGRNPPCEQADMFLDFFNPLREDHTDAVSESEENAFLVTPCPGDDD